MTPKTTTADRTTREPLRLWPGVTAAVVLLLLRFGTPIVSPGFEGFRIALLGGFAGVLAIGVWWLFFSRARWSERVGAPLLIVLALIATLRLNHPSLGVMWCIFLAIPLLSLALVVWAVAGNRLADSPRRRLLVAIVLLTCGVWTLVRMDGLTGDHSFELAWRWTDTREQRLLGHDDGPGTLAAIPAPSATEVGWAGFRGPRRNGIVPAVRIATDWSTSPPVELWRRPVGPGWSSFAVGGDLLYTQEQRGDDEIVACHSLLTGEPVWRHRDVARFYEAMGGAGPRATPALGNGRVYALGATGILNVLDAISGAVVWTRDVASDSKVPTPVWGFAGSPLLIDDIVVVAASGRVIAYDRETGDPRWFGPDGGHSYSSPQFVTIDGIGQIVLLSAAGATGIAPADGNVLWTNPWPGVPLVQPAVTAGGILTSAGEGHGVRRLAVARGAAGWTVEERWTSNRLKPNFNDFVVHEGHAFGFDGSILACIDLDDGERKWKGGRYGQGQLLLLADQALLLVLSERGELVLVRASGEAFGEVARFPAMDGKTWNHPVLVDGVLLVRNSQEMAAFRIGL